MLQAEVRSARYGAVEVLRDISIEVGEREIVAVLGGNGAGKTTLLRTLSGVLTRADASIWLQGAEVAGRRAHLRAAAGLAHIPEGRRVFRDLTVLENLQVASYARRSSAKELAEDLDRVFDMFPRLRERRAQRATSLSGGEQQMLAIGRGLMTRPALLMIDEASLGLAPALVQEMFRALSSLRADGLSLLLVEQNVRESLRLADRAYVLARGTVVVQARAAELLADSRVAETYLGLAGSDGSAAPFKEAAS